MKRRTVIRCAAALVMVVPGSGIAQRNHEAETGSHIPVPRRARISDAVGLSDLDRGRLAMREFARCAVDSHPRYVSSYLTNGASRTDLRKIAGDECLDSGEMRFQPDLLRGALFVELVRRRADAQRRHAAWAMPASPLNVAEAVKAAPGDAMTLMLWFADCVVRRDPAAAMQLVTAPTASPAQNMAFGALGPDLGPCLPQGSKLVLSKPVLEGAVAEILYREPDLSGLPAKAGN